MVGIGRVIEALGGRGVIGNPGKPRLAKAAERDEDALIERVRSGLPYSTLETISTRFGIRSSEMLRILRLPYRTLARRKKAGILSASESDRLARLGRIGGLAEEVLGSPARAGRWLREPNPALGDTPPLRWLDTDLGAQEVEHVLSRIAHGVHS
jgi:putative toxin-antitoxin system antitoxin component (TIGR02293 family)